MFMSKCHIQGKLCQTIDILSYRSLYSLYHHLRKDDELREGESWKRIVERMEELRRKPGVEAEHQAAVDDVRRGLDRIF
jgi:type II secretory ATPase GspE/PulE/Tfp pilus assembly ATPase PilB-like protein